MQNPALWCILGSENDRLGADSKRRHGWRRGFWMGDHGGKKGDVEEVDVLGHQSRDVHLQQRWHNRPTKLSNRWKKKQFYGLLCRSKSFKVTKVGTNRKPVCDFLLVIDTNWHHISYRFEVILVWQLHGLHPDLLDELSAIPESKFQNLVNHTIV